MGLRGPGARALRRKPGEPPAAPQEPQKHPWDEPGLSRAERVIRFVESLPVTSGALAGTRFRLRPFQRKMIGRVYKTTRAGRRQVRTAVWSMARKNGKTDLAARLALCHIAGPEAEPRGEVYSAANDRFQAGRTFSEICAIITRTPWLAARVSIRRHSKELEDIEEAGGTGTVYAALSADVGTKHGLSPSFVVYDEYGQAEKPDLYDVLDSAMGARAEPLMMVISTQAARDEAPLSQLIDYGLRVQRGEVDDPSFHLTLFTAPPEADPWERATWKLANPALGDFRSLEDVQRMALQAQRMPSKAASFRNLILNQRVDTTAQFLSAAVWKPCGGAVEVEHLKGRRCYGGLDLSQSRDLTALVLVFEDDDESYDVLPFFWLPADDLREREDTDRVPYVRWAEEGFLQTSPGRTIDPKAVALKIAELHGQYDIEALAYDRWRIEDLRRELDAIGCDVVLVPHGQGFKDMSPSIDVLERLIFEAKIRHGGHPVLTMCASNAKTASDPAGNRKLDKQKSTGRIDGLVAMTMAVGRAASGATARSVYEGDDRPDGLLVI
ncbi:terminase TerL endonuclease subunit [Reyranella sp.]|jgi:phage terminase large subunit-like protein|uniref:terminase large subunit n=1 Tax=Reyranella sp. TaxID=1929291 RepID=UPI000BC9833E|nr:terminase TerL endonuclease subunit [Reyranella sp.]OYY40451.1 MAG: terminase [Rhodospirillales bacterium 35-66-84]OYZ93068.1 MAG: terminase [Rhodospirillales bacterium 24-66-33]OZB24196.1 MAG: terminase [Rhodospirillales bacterium 39-66-50]HQS18790.1 terminase large subunit [Reyranella sp.]HQT14900.1 terminase large subunit [Reyranella sp.]